MPTREELQDRVNKEWQAAGELFAGEVLIESYGDTCRTSPGRKRRYPGPEHGRNHRTERRRCTDLLLLGRVSNPTPTGERKLNLAKIITSQVRHLPLKGNPMTVPIHLKVDFADAPSSGNVCPSPFTPTAAGYFAE